MSEETATDCGAGADYDTGIDEKIGASGNHGQDERRRPIEGQALCRHPIPRQRRNDAQGQNGGRRQRRQQQERRTARRPEGRQLQREDVLPAGYGGRSVHGIPVLPAKFLTISVSAAVVSTTGIQSKLRRKCASDSSSEP